MTGPLRHSAIYIRDTDPGSEIDVLYSHGGLASGKTRLGEYLDIYRGEETVAYRLKLSETEIQRLTESLEQNPPGVGYREFTNNCTQYCERQILKAAELDLIQYRSGEASSQLIGSPRILSNQVIAALLAYGLNELDLEGIIQYIFSTEPENQTEEE